MELAFGDPVSRWHPVAVFGCLIESVLRHAPPRGERRRLAYGAIVVVAAVGGVAAAASLALYALEGLGGVFAILAGALLLKASFSYRQLEREALVVAANVDAGRLATARSSLQALVGRDTERLSPALVGSAAIESLAENLSDSVVAPLLYYVLFGVPGALAYRAINTLDAMVGYHGAYEHLGRAAARLDDAANLVPSRLTAALLVVASALAGADYRRAAELGLRDHGQTESPNAGWPMATMAGALGVRLEKVGHYRLGDPTSECSPAAIRRAVRVGRRASAAAAALALFAAWALGG